MKKQFVTLQIVYDENESDPPAEWDWDELADIAAHESVKVTDATDIEDVPESETDDD